MELSKASPWDRHLARETMDDYQTIGRNDKTIDITLLQWVTESCADAWGRERDAK
ncbi:hypothetical protein W02_24920 [Nitrospira sp. KM1]|nr:hypothetical protein W02_24920 [Nitrospira sp. KM1]